MADERAVRARLGVPAGAERVIIFGESSHWDPDWLFTAEEYYRRRIRKILDKAVAELLEEPRRVYSIECVFFLKMYWDRNPERQDLIRELVNQGRMRLTGSGITTPDTTLPETEAILRDYLIGQEWLRQNGMTPEPRLAYLPDDFGHSPALPSMLHALGYDMAAIARIDGCYFPGADYRLPSYYPRPGSSAELLQKQLKTADFIWRGPDGSTVLCHWNPFTYFQGDSLALFGLGRWMGIEAGVPARSGRAVAKKIDGYVKRLAPLARTPYLFCPIGCDFVEPIRGLIELLDGYNNRRFRETGVWAQNAGLDDYLELVSCHREKLPELALDPNPYWMGFYSSRPEMKMRCSRLARDLIRAESALAPSPEYDQDPEIARELSAAWETAAVSNHHDFITGTAPERVWLKEQLPMLERAQARADKLLQKAGAVAGAGAAALSGALPQWGLSRGRLTVETSWYVIELDEAAGGGITRWLDPESGAAKLAGLGNELVSYKDSGGLWRMGHEFNGGVFREKARAGASRASLSAVEEHHALRVEAESILEGARFVRRLWFTGDSPVVRMSLEGGAPRRRTICCRFRTALSPAGLCMDVPGGVVQRPLIKIYDPTFWAAASFAHLRDVASGQGLAVFLGGPASVSANGRGVVEWVGLRNAPRERAFGVLPVPSCPARGDDTSSHTLDYALWFTGSGDWRENRLLAAARRMRADFAGNGAAAQEAGNGFTISDPEVIIGAVKRASRGQGLIVRLFRFGKSADDIRLRWGKGPILKAALCDARERDLQPLSVDRGEAVVPARTSLITVRVRL
ncbi:MAG TPA: hypothetical protein VM658_06355 [bacterium]|nr:hypothetical protein [bacterium]